MTGLKRLQGRFHIALMGDLNTMGHGIARLSPHFCTDRTRFRNLGKTEAQVWDEIVVEQLDEAYAIEHDGKPKQLGTQRLNGRLKGLGLDEATCRDALNPGWHLSILHLELNPACQRLKNTVLRSIPETEM